MKNQRAADSSASSESKQQTRILLVDDDKLIQASIAKNLNLYGYEVIVASDGKSALEQYRKESPDVVLLDINLPDVGGFSVLKAIRKENPDAEVIFITGEGDMNLVIEALRSGVSDFVPKPLSIGVLRSVLENAEARLRQKSEKSATVETTTIVDERSAAPIQVRAFGSLELRIQNRVVSEKDWRNFKTAAIFKILLIQHKKVVTLDELVELVWQGVSQRSAEVMVFTAVSFIRRLFEPTLKNGRHSNYVRTHEAGYELNMGKFGRDYFYDVEEFERLVRLGRETGETKHYHDAIEQYSDELLKNNRDDEWSGYLREKLRDSYLSVLQTLADKALAEKNFEAVSEWSRRMLSADSLYEPAYALLIESYLAQRRPRDAKRILEQCDAAFQKSLNINAPKYIADLLR